MSQGGSLQLNVPFTVSGGERPEFNKDVSSSYKEPATLGSKDITVNTRASNPCAYEVYTPVGVDRQQTNKKQNSAKYIATSESDVCQLEMKIRQERETGNGHTGVKGLPFTQGACRSPLSGVG